MKILKIILVLLLFFISCASYSQSFYPDIVYVDGVEYPGEVNFHIYDNSMVLKDGDNEKTFLVCRQTIYDNAFESKVIDLCCGRYFTITILHNSTDIVKIYIWSQDRVIQLEKIKPVQ